MAEEPGTQATGVLTTLLLALPPALAHPQSFAPSASTQAAALAALTGFVLTLAVAIGSLAVLAAFLIVT